MLTKITISFKKENLKTQYNILSCRIEWYSHDYKLAIEIDENGHNNKNTEHKEKGKKQYNKNLVISLLELIVTKKALIFLELLMKYLDTLKNTNK